MRTFPAWARFGTHGLARTLVSAAQPQPKDRGEINAFVPSWALCCAALKGATSSLKGQTRFGVMREVSEDCWGPLGGALAEQ